MTGISGETGGQYRMKLVVGLGNPGAQYRANRHNVGFQVLDGLAGALGSRFDATQQRSDVARATIGTEKVVLAKPRTFMNDSGIAVGGLIRFYKLSLEDLLVVYDDLDLPLGRLRLRADGGHGGHNGMRSIIEQLGMNDFARLRIGIGRPPGRMEPVAYVLQDFSRQDEAVMAEARSLAVKEVLAWISQGIEAAMNAFNTSPLENKQA